MNLIDKIPLTHYKPIRFRDELIWKNFDQINGFITRNFEIGIQDVLAKPFLSGNNVHWHTSRIGQYKSLDTLSMADRQKVVLRYHGLLDKVNGRIKALNANPNQDNLIWGQLLSFVFNPTNNILYSDGNNFVIVWGFEFNNNEENSIDPLILSAYLASLTPNEKEAIEDGKLETDEVLANAGVSDASRIDQNSNLFKKIIIRSNKKQYHKDGFLRNFWWVPLVLGLLIYFLYLNFHSNGSSVAPANEKSIKEIIPANPLKRPPLDSSKLIKGDSSASMIISNVFNIALKNRSQKLDELALSLKNKFPDSAYKIVFYDTSISRLQFQFPDTDRNLLREKIKKELSAFELLIWDESIFKTSKTFNDPSFSDPTKSWYFSAVGAYVAWDMTSGVKNVVIAVIDDGFDLTNLDFNGKVIKPFNVKYRNSAITSSVARFHGTHVAGIALGNSNNNHGISGIAPNCSFMPIQVSNEGEDFTSSDVIDGLLYAIRNGADVINLSLGKYFPEELAAVPSSQQKALISSIGKDEELFWNELFELAEVQKTVIVMAAGNQNVLVGLDPMQRSSRTIKVAAVNTNLEQAAFSNYGDLVTVYAPGEKIYSLIPGNDAKYMDGTSMATPIVSGAVALMKSMRSELSTSEIIRLIKANSEFVKNRDNKSVYLRIDKVLKILS